MKTIDYRNIYNHIFRVDEEYQFITNNYEFSGNYQ